MGSNLVSNVSLRCQAPPARVYSSLRPAPPASTHNSNGNSSFSSLPKPLAADDPKLSGESVQHASANPKLSGAAHAFFSSRGKAGKHVSHHSSATGGRTCIRQGRSGNVLPEQANFRRAAVVNGEGVLRSTSVSCCSHPRPLPAQAAVVVKHAWESARCSPPCGSAAVGTRGGHGSILLEGPTGSDQSGPTSMSGPQAPTPITPTTWKRMLTTVMLVAS